MTIQGSEGMFVKEMNLSNAEENATMSKTKGSLKGRDASLEARNRKAFEDGAED